MPHHILTRRGLSRITLGEYDFIDSRTKAARDLHRTSQLWLGEPTVWSTHEILRGHILLAEPSLLQFADNLANHAAKIILLKNPFFTSVCRELSDGAAA